MADYTQLMNLEKKQKGQQFPSHAQQKTPVQSTEQSTNQSISRLTNLSPSRSTIPNGDKVMDKPRGFYITERLNKRIDEAVRYYQEKHNLKKVDRSIVVTTILDSEANWTEEALELILDKVISQLTNRLTNR